MLIAAAVIAAVIFAYGYVLCWREWMGYALEESFVGHPCRLVGEMVYGALVSFLWVIPCVLKLARRLQPKDPDKFVAKLAKETTGQKDRRREREIAAREKRVQQLEQEAGIT